MLSLRQDFLEKRKLNQRGTQKFSFQQEQIPFIVNHLRKTALFTFIFLFFVTLELSFAQNIPSGESAGAQAERFKQKTEEEQKAVQKKVEKPQIEIKEKEEKPQAPLLKFTLKEIKITGVTIFKAQDFKPLYQSYLNQEVSQADLEKVIQGIKDKYKEKGYFTVIAYLPEQDVKEGVVEIRVVEGKMGSLKIEGNKYFSNSLIEKYFHTKKNEVLNLNKIQRDILRLNQTSDLEVKTIISPGKEPETANVTLKVKDSFPWHVGFSEDNQGSRLTGKYRSSLYLRSSNATGNLDSFFVSTLYSGRSLGESLSYNIPVSSYGTKFGIDVTYFKDKLGQELKAFDINGVSQIYDPHLLWELYLDEIFQAYFRTGLEIRSITKKIDENLTASDQLRIPYFSFDLNRNDNYGSTHLSPQFSFGTGDFLGASNRNHPTASRQGTGGFYFKYEQNASRTQRMPFESYAQLRSDIAVATHTLPSSEQIQIGGFNSVRGYPEGDYLADFGGYLQCDWYFPMYLIPKDYKLPRSQMPLRNQIEPVFFFDLGGGKLKKVITGEKHDKFLAGVGGGFRVRLNNKFFLRLEWAEHIGDRPTSGSGPSTFYLTFQSEI